MRIYFHPKQLLPALVILTCSQLFGCQSDPSDDLEVQLRALSSYPVIVSSNGLSLCDQSSAASATPKSTVLTAMGTFAAGATFEWTVSGSGNSTIGTTQTLNVPNNGGGSFTVRWVDPVTKIKSAYSDSLVISTRSCGTSAAPDYMADNNPGDAPASFACNPATIAPGEQLRRLTGLQYRNTIRDLVKYALRDNASLVSGVFSRIESALASLPKGVKVTNSSVDPRGGYVRMDQLVNDELVTAFHTVAQSAGMNLSATLGTLAGACATDNNAANDDQCITDFVVKFGARALRRPLSSAEVTFYKGFHSTSNISRTGFADIISALLQAPEFLYMVETAGSSVATNVLKLTPFELAARLSYHFWQTMPDEELWQAAASGALANDATYAAQVERLFVAAPTLKTINEFYYDYLQIGAFLSGPALDRNISDPAFKAFAGADLPTETLAPAMAMEIENMFESLTSKGAGYDDLFTSDADFTQARDTPLRGIYNIANWGDTVGPNRKGFLTRAMFLATGSTITRPVQKGLFIRRAILCDRVDPVPKSVEVMAVEQKPSTEFTSRAKIESLTSSSSCIYCHKLINGLGFATENFDGLGRIRSEERLFSPSGELVSSPKVNTKSSPYVDTSDAASTSTGAEDLAKLILASGKGQACFARNYFRFTFGRWEDVAKDGCALEQLRQILNNKGSLKSMLKSIALTSSFKQRSIQ
jgi:hypothetical protein